MNIHAVPCPASVVALLLCLAVAPARADFSFNFNNGNDAGLTHYDPLAPFGSGATYTFPILGAGNDGYRLTSNPSADPNTLGPSRVGSYRADQTFGDFRLSVDVVTWNPQLVQGFGLAARLSNIGLGTSNGYYLHFNPSSPSFPGQAGLALDRIDGEQADPDNAFMPLSPLDFRAGFRMVFTGSGSTLTGQVFALNNLNSALATVTLIDSTYRSGFAGLLATNLVGEQNVGVDVTYDNLQASSVPEPTSLSMLAVGVFGLIARSRLRARG